MLSHFYPNSSTFSIFIDFFKLFFNSTTYIQLTSPLAFRLQRANEQDDNEENLLADSFKSENIIEISQRDDGYIELVLRVLARMCDGQHGGLQVSEVMVGLWWGYGGVMVGLWWGYGGL